MSLSPMTEERLDRSRETTEAPDHVIFVGNGHNVALHLSPQTLEIVWRDAINSEINGIIKVARESEERALIPSKLAPTVADSEFRALLRSRALYQWYFEDQLNPLKCTLHDILRLFEQDLPPGCSERSRDLTEDEQMERASLLEKLHQNFSEFQDVAAQYLQYLTRDERGNLAWQMPYIYYDLQLLDRWLYPQGEPANYLAEFAIIMTKTWQFPEPRFNASRDREYRYQEAEEDICKVIDIKGTADERELLEKHKDSLEKAASALARRDGEESEMSEECSEMSEAGPEMSLESQSTRPWGATLTMLPSRALQEQANAQSDSVDGFGDDMMMDVDSIE